MNLDTYTQAQLLQTRIAELDTLLTTVSGNFLDDLLPGFLDPSQVTELNTAARDAIQTIITDLRNQYLVAFAAL